MSGILNMLLAGGFLPITIPTNWGVSSPSASPQTSASKVLTVPAGNPGKVKLHFTAAPAGTAEYQINAGAFTALTDNLILTVANSDTLRFRLTGSSGDSFSLLVTDNTLLTTIGTCTLQIA